MKHFVVAALSFAILAASMSAWSKGVITKITIQRLGSDAVFEITDKEVLSRFTIWSGPGVGGWDAAKTIPAPDDAAFIIDWTKGTLSGARAPAGYHVTLYVDQYAPTCKKYEVFYEVNAAGAGHVYLPRWDEEIGRCNMSLIARDVEGHWFHASRAWDDVVKRVGVGP